MPTRFPSFNILFAAAEEGGHGSSFWGLFIYLGLVLGIVVLALHLAKKSFGERVFKTMSSQLVEQVYLFIENLCVSTIGAHGRKYIPMIMTFWLVIFVGNLVGSVASAGS